jgi:endoglycosylceramidase
MNTTVRLTALCLACSALALLAACSDEGDAKATADVAVADGSGSGEGSAEGSAVFAPLPPCDLPRPSLTTDKLTIDGRFFRDALGRKVLLRGVNTGGRSKTAPFFPFPFAESGHPGQEEAPAFAQAAETYVARVEAWGMNTVRLPIIWEAVEPARGSYDTAYLARVRELIEVFGRRNIRVVVDMHQDLFARAYCGDGAPDWALASPVPPRPENEDCEGWFMGYISDETGLVFPAFDRFWQNGDGIRDAFREMWTEVARQLWPVRNVVGFEIFNEPHPGTDNEERWGRDVLTPFYTEIAAAIREAAPGAPVFFDTSGTDATDQTFFIERPDGGNMVWAPHYYDPRVFLGIPITESFSAMRPVTFLEEQGERWQVPVFLGEFGAKYANPNTPLYLRKTYDALDAFSMHSTAWEYSTDSFDWNLEGFSLVEPDGTERPAADELVRVYPAAIAGSGETFTFSKRSRIGSLAWNATAGGITEVAIPSRLYPNGASVTVAASERELCGRYDSETGLLLLRSATDGGQSIRVTPNP